MRSLPNNGKSVIYRPRHPGGPMKGTCSIPMEKRFQPGVSGNPKGCPPKEKCIPVILRKYAAMPASPGAIKFLRKVYPQRVLMDDIPTHDVILMRAEYDAEWGDEDARKFYAERTDGKVREHFDLTTEGEKINKPTINVSAFTTENLTMLRELIRVAIRNKANAQP